MPRKTHTKPRTALQMFVCLCRLIAAIPLVGVKKLATKVLRDLIVKKKAHTESRNVDRQEFLKAYLDHPQCPYELNYKQYQKAKALQEKVRRSPANCSKAELVRARKQVGLIRTIESRFSGARRSLEKVLQRNLGSLGMKLAVEKVTARSGKEGYIIPFTKVVTAKLSAKYQGKIDKLTGRKKVIDDLNQAVP